MSIENRSFQKIISLEQNTKKQGEKMTFDQWTREVSKTVLPQSDEINKSFSTYFSFSDEDFEEEEPSPSLREKK